VRLSSIWIAGLTRSGKTTQLVHEFSHWVQEKLNGSQAVTSPDTHAPSLASTALVLAANDDNRRDLVDRLSLSIQGRQPVNGKTFLGLICDEVILFWPILFEALQLKAQFPLRLRPETEQELATRLWRPQLDKGDLGKREYRFVRQTLDLLQLAGASGIRVEDIPSLLEQGFAGDRPLEAESGIAAQQRGDLLLTWRQWCLERGLLSYGIIYELYWRYLLPNPQYQQHLIRRYQAVFADDVDDYPAIARDLFDFLLDRGAFAVFTYNQNGQIRLGLNADPAYLAELAVRCQVKQLSLSQGLAADLEEIALPLLDEPRLLASLPDSIHSIQATSRAQLLRKTAEVIIQAVKSGEVQPEEIAIIAPGLDEIARYTLIEILSASGIAILPLNEQRSLISSPLIRALLTLLGLIYPGLGRLVRRDDVAEMLVVLSQIPQVESVGLGNSEFRIQNSEFFCLLSPACEVRKLVPEIDPVRAGLLADYCYHIDPEQPRLLPIETFPRWDRIGHRAANAYKEILEWLEESKAIGQQQPFASPLFLLDRAVKRFTGNGHYLPYEQLAALRELIETAQHYWEVERRLRQHDPLSQPATAAIAQFIQLLRRGTITANPRPMSAFLQRQQGVTLATIFQYRSRRSCHRWQFWLDASSPLWEKGGAATLFAAPLFLRNWSGRPLLPEDEVEADRSRLQRILRDLLGRASDCIYLCHSDLGNDGTEQLGPLLTLVHAVREED
jgi:hypothetical protein